MTFESAMLTRLAERDVPDFTAAIHFIGGSLAAGEGEAFEVTFPVTGEVLATVNEASPRQVDAAMAAARASFDDGTWRKTSPA